MHSRISVGYCWMSTIVGLSYPVCCAVLDVQLCPRRPSLLLKRTHLDIRKPRRIPLSICDYDITWRM